MSRMVVASIEAYIGKKVRIYDKRNPDQQPIGDRDHKVPFDTKIKE